jgi:hypothetical protein
MGMAPSGAPAFILAQLAGTGVAAKHACRTTTMRQFALSSCPVRCLYAPVRREHFLLGMAVDHTEPFLTVFAGS